MALLTDLDSVVAAAFELGIAILLVASGARDRVRAGLVVILVGNAMEALTDPLIHSGLFPQDLDKLAGVVDPIIAMSIAYVLSMIPVPLGGDRGARIGSAIWLAGSSIWLIVGSALYVSGAATSVGDLARVVPQIGGFLLAAYLLLTHVVPRWRSLAPGPRRGQVLFLAGGLGIGLTAIGTSNFFQLIQPPVGDVGREVAFSMILAMMVASIACLMIIDRGRDARLLALLLAAGAVFALSDQLFQNSLIEFSSQVIRPSLIAFAILRYDLVEMPKPARDLVLPVTAIAFAITLVFGLSIALSGRTDRLDPFTTTVAIAAIAGATIFSRGALQRTLRGTGGETSDAQRIDRYRLALETESPSSLRVVELRRRLRITDDEHETILAIIRTHVVVPTRAVRGLATGDRVADRYTVIRELGRGGQGRALLAEDTSARTLVVLKEATRPWEEGAAERRVALQREAEVGARLDSPRVARVHTIIEEDGILYLVRAFVDGKTVDEAVRASGPFPSARAIAIILDVLEGVDALHRAGLLHLDLKPSNIVISQEGRATIIDLGVARAQAVASGTLTQGAAAGGSLGWMAPEQARGERVGPTADVYGAGALLAFLATGRAPTGSAMPMPDAPALAAIVDRACASQTSARYPDAASMQAALRLAATPVTS